MKKMLNFIAAFLVVSEYFFCMFTIQMLILTSLGISTEVKEEKRM